MYPVLPLFAPDQQRYPGQRQTRARIHRPDNGDPTHGITATNCGVSLLVPGLTLCEGELQMRPLHRNYAIIVCIQFLPSAKNLACCQQNLGLAIPQQRDSFCAFEGELSTAAVQQHCQSRGFSRLAVVFRYLNQRLKAPLQLLSNSQSRPCSRWHVLSTTTPLYSK